MGRPCRVAPFTGAWIETSHRLGRPVLGREVAPFTGAWIETSPWPSAVMVDGVAPFTGAWIETPYLVLPRMDSRRALHGRVD